MARRRSDQGGKESILPHHVSRSTSFTSLPSGEVSSGDDSSTESLWLSPTVPIQNEDAAENGALLPTWSANPQSPDSSRRSSCPANISSSVVSVGNSSRSNGGMSLLFTCFVLVSVSLIAGVRESLNRTTARVVVFQNHKEEIGSSLQKFEKDLRVLQRELSGIEFVVHRQEGGGNGVSHSEGHITTHSEITELEYRLQHEAKLAFNLKKQVQALSRTEIFEKFGNQVHLVEMELIFPDNNSGPRFFTIEMAPTDLMPHSVHTFLEMVNARLLDGCSFILNALNVVKAAPLPYDGRSASDKAKAFSDKGLESVVFKEYSENFPHKKYTVGFAADGSPSFYINTADNSEIHVGDPCFGRVISGFDTVQRLAANPTRNGIWFERRIGIKAARIVTR
jgi:cyclophilin family peptidyl-prolyl cis-trans isomerase